MGYPATLGYFREQTGFSGHPLTRNFSLPPTRLVSAATARRFEGCATAAKRSSRTPAAPAKAITLVQLSTNSETGGEAWWISGKNWKSEAVTSESSSQVGEDLTTTTWVTPYSNNKNCVTCLRPTDVVIGFAVPTALATSTALYLLIARRSRSTRSASPPPPFGQKGQGIDHDRQGVEVSPLITSGGPSTTSRLLEHKTTPIGKRRQLLRALRRRHR